ncbi:DUF3889 domain-containing protein [Paenibacillus sp. S150]|uniref:DUF3889 domain-containing protein n=1 Tax=Paenibacillus sp. S150 TaxID=2749826 RepID=UPI001C55F037|nr:DUF3889 domain-containing protein [Paenibacillus sp. S150]MBW4083746.1 DUF3889 domain-containing protein [Paenibacillus sp. S150]
MKKSWLISLLALFLVIGSPVSSAAPGYAKWGTVAVKAAQQKYNADIIDYKHVGRTQIQPKLTEELFKLWIRTRAGKEFGVFVAIRFDPSTDQIQTIQFSETNR